LNIIRPIWALVDYPIGSIGGAKSSLSWQYLPVNPDLQTQVKSGLPAIVVVVMQVPPVKHGLLAQLSGMKQFG